MRGIQITEAVYSKGVLKPVDPLELRETERVRLVVQPLDEVSATDREAAFRRLVERGDRMNFYSQGPLPTRDELHDRS
jgi:predicted DNA-binding antitoxin AbrB/MazE fold protein